MPKQDPKSGKSGRSSKTARVLNLLTDPESIEPPAKSSASQSTAGSAKLSDDRQAQAKIRDALEDTLEMELSAAVSTPAHPRRARSARSSLLKKNAQELEQQFLQESQPAEAVEAPAAAEAETSKAAEESAAPSDWPSAPSDWPSTPSDWPSASEQIFSPKEPEDAPLGSVLNELRAAGEEKPDEFICFNVMQALVEDKVDKYMKMFGLCTCNRCHIDVVALALSNLPPKYVVAKPHELIPRLSMYEQKFSVVVVTQVMSACRKVLDRPHHQRKEN